MSEIRKFGKIKMSEAVRLGDILPEVLRDIERRCELNPNNPDFKPERGEHRDRVFSAMADFLTNRKAKRVNWQRQSSKQKALF